MGEKIVVYDFEHNQTRFITDDLADVTEALKEVANSLDVVDGCSESVRIEVSCMTKIEFDALEDFEEVL